jgi:phosphoribosylformylglycinamidine synthase subunit PurS
VLVALYQVRWAGSPPFAERHAAERHMRPAPCVGLAAESGKICVHSQECPVARVVVDVMLKPEILDPQGQAVANALPRLGVSDVTSVRIGRRIEIEFAGEADLDRAREIADKLLANTVIEDFTVHVSSGEAAEAEAAEAPA